MILAGLALPLSGQTVLPPAALATTPAAPDELALSKAGNRMTVPVTIGAAGPFAFIIDTGAERTVIARELATTLGLTNGRTVRLTAITGTSNVGTVTIPSLRVSTIASAPIEAPALAAANLGAQGMLGIDTLRGHRLAIDFERDRMTVTSSSKRPSAPDRAGDIVVRAKSFLGQLIVTDAHFRGRRIRVILDTGSSVSMGNVALRQHIRQKREPQQIVLTSVTGGQTLADYTQVERIEIGGVEFMNLPIAFADVAPFRRFGLNDQPALLLGMDAMRLFRHVEIDFANREVRFARPMD